MLRGCSSEMNLGFDFGYALWNGTCPQSCQYNFMYFKELIKSPWSKVFQLGFNFEHESFLNGH